MQSFRPTHTKCAFGNNLSSKLYLYLEKMLKYTCTSKKVKKKRKKEEKSKVLKIYTLKLKSDAKHTLKYYKKESLKIAPKGLMNH